MKKVFFACFVFAFPLLAETNVLVFAGSTRSDSYNKKLAQEAANMAHVMGANATFLDLKDYPMPFYDEDLEKKEGMPEHAKRFRDAMIASDAIVIASPEYNASISAVLKNALDWASRTSDASGSAFEGKRFAIMSASPGKMGGVRGLLNLKTIIEALGGQVVEKQVSIGQAYREGALSNEDVKAQLKKELSELLNL